MVDISAVIPVRNEAGTLKDLHSSLKKELETLKKTYEITYVNDGSTDDSANILHAIQMKDTHVKVINFDRHYGQADALQAGFDLAQGNIIVTLDADMENDPFDIDWFISRLDEGYDVVCGRRVGRPANLNSFLSYFGNFVFRLFFRTPASDMACTLRAYKKDILKGLVITSTLHRYLPALLYMRGAKIAQIEVRYKPRRYGESKYNNFSRAASTLKDLFRMVFDRNGILNNKVRGYKIREIWQ
jgi:glycosyltransferase involved in cell wall biosynthesis